MLKMSVVFALACTGLAAHPESLAKMLRSSGIPPTGFTRAELAQDVDAMDAKDSSATYLVYLPADENSADDVAPRLVRFDHQSGKVLRSNLKPKDIESCCGTGVEQIDLTQNYLLASFHLNPSTAIVLVADKGLRYKTMLYGFDFHEIAPDRVVYTEDDVHFASAHPGRVAYADLRTGEAQELYPPKGDRLRAAFAAFHKEHMPPQPDCQTANDPCDPQTYDEDVDFLKSGENEFRIRVSRSGAHRWVTGSADVDIPFAVADYTYKLGPGGWLYCEVEELPQKLVKSDSDAGPDPESKGSGCEASLPVVPDGAGDFAPHGWKGQ